MALQINIPFLHNNSSGIDVRRSNAFLGDLSLLSGFGKATAAGAFISILYHMFGYIQNQYDQHYGRN